MEIDPFIFRLSIFILSIFIGAYTTISNPRISKNPLRLFMLCFLMVLMLGLSVVVTLQAPVFIFAAAIVGGIGNPFGAFLGGYVIAFSEILLTYAYKKFFMYILPESMEPESLVQLLSTDYKFAVSFSILVIVLLFRPSGIFKGKVL